MNSPQTRSRANPLAHNPLRSREHLARAVVELHEPLLPHVSPGGARVRLGSFASVFDETTAELEGFSRPLSGIVPLVVGGHEFAHWDLVVRGLDAGTNPSSSEYWGPVPGDNDQRMVEQAAIGLALAFCPEHVWEPLDPAARERLVGWLQGIFEHDPNPNNWQSFRVLVSLGLERVGASFDRHEVDRSLDLIDSYRVGEHWYADGALRNVDWYVPFAFHTYGLLYAAANDLGLADDARADALRERAAGFAPDLLHWFDPTGAAVPFGRSLTYRFAMGSFWSMLAWADVETDVSWGLATGMLMRHLRWWADEPISDRDGVLSIGYTYDNRRLQETYSSAGSPYWCMKAFGALAAPAHHPFWTSAEESLPPLDARAHRRRGQSPGAARRRRRRSRGRHDLVDVVSVARRARRHRVLGGRRVLPRSRASDRHRPATHGPRDRIRRRSRRSGRVPVGARGRRRRCQAANRGRMLGDPRPRDGAPGVLALIDGISASTGSSESIGRDGGRDGPG